MDGLSVEPMMYHRWHKDQSVWVQGARVLQLNQFKKNKYKKKMQAFLNQLIFKSMILSKLKKPFIFVILMLEYAAELRYSDPKTNLRLPENLGHKQSRWYVDSTSASQKRHSLVSLRPILKRWSFTGKCPVIMPIETLNFCLEKFISLLPVFFDGCLTSNLVWRQESVDFHFLICSCND